eukprot:scaffold251699_cov31-Tisochrysis_lutea.AAC.1
MQRIADERGKSVAQGIIRLQRQARGLRRRKPAAFAHALCSILTTWHRSLPPQNVHSPRLPCGVVPIPGCRNAQMAADNCGALDWSLDDGEVAALEDAAESLGFEFSGGGFGLED